MSLLFGQRGFLECPVTPLSVWTVIGGRRLVLLPICTLNAGSETLISPLVLNPVPLVSPSEVFLNSTSI